MVYYIDLFSLDEPRQLATLGLDEIFNREAVVLIERGEKFQRYLPPERIEIRIRTQGDGRLVEVYTTTEREGLLHRPL
jgi:tRNA threonylcarbamoyladenosine biosynthesis protein TsaE